ncbi:type VI secretion system membrane subunit TssM [Xenorhabdus sp. PB30.3]|uniref:type VI secretion system membrane subunit TssM n=1 Tax=Xenorhabdus sp. PB30.3 TaxID=2788941 RepID=UPI001E62DEB8|nr:type VI secretion system membrane subunit TssM [Xenorhabdus sp. PB30.3]MCC8378255.1 type VI secretion system membrane subunit TssM [Xenorhabdus sp. PB30.3]
MLNVLLSIITSRLTWSFIGITILACIIGFWGPIISVGDVVPFKSFTIRVATIAFLYFFWVISLLIPHLYRTWLNKKLANQLNIIKGSESEKTQEKQQNEQHLSLSERFSDAVKLLRKAYFSGLNGKNKPTLRGFFSRQYLYQLPWYLVIGAPGSGKTTALSNSGLNFPLLDYFGRAALHSMQDSNSCNWWFTTNAVLLDTAGRYTIQDNTVQKSNFREWKTFIKLLKKYRTRQPINGVILTLSVEDLLNPSTEARDNHAYMLRRRLSELHEKFKTQFPVYLFITKTDLLKGFTAYFTHLDKASREQIWGLTFPQNNKVDWNINAAFDEQYRQLQRRLDAELPYILLNESNPQQSAESYLFPQEFAALHPYIAQYLEIIFARSGFEAPSYPRGLYFTSGKQEGIPFDSVMEKFNQNVQLPTDNNSISMSWGNGEDKGMHYPSQAQQPYFLKNLLEGIFQEAGLASYNRWWIYKNRLVNWLGYMTLIAILIAVTTLFLTSYHNNENYLAEIQAKMPSITKLGDELKQNTNNANEANNIYNLLPMLNTLANLAQSQHFSLDDPPISYRMGLYTGELVNDAGHDLYTKALQSLLLPHVARLITDQLKQVSNNDIDKTYSALKAYQMLYQPDHYDGKFLRNWVMQYLEAQLAPDTPEIQFKQLDWHLGQLLDNQPVTSPYVFDSSLVESRQAFISSTPLAVRTYARLQSALLNNPDLEPVNLVTLAGPQADLAFSHISNEPITSGVPGLFTPAGYQKIIKDMEPLIAGSYIQDSWVLGSYAKKQPVKLVEQSVRQIYVNDYIYQWDKFLGDIRLNHIDDLTQRANTARLLSSSVSPLRLLLINISKNLTLNDPLNSLMNKGKNIAKLGSLSSKTSNLANKANRLANLAPQQMILQNNGQPSPENMLEAHFAQITDLAKNPDGKNPQIPFDDILKKISELYQYLTSVQNAVNTGSTFPPNNIITQLQTASERLPMPFRDMITSLAIGASSDAQISDMRSVGKQLSSEIGGFCNQAITNRYPLVATAHVDIKPDDMARMFAPEKGMMDSFYKKNLEGKVDTSQPQWRFMPGVDGKPLPGGARLLRPFQQAKIISDTFFGNGTPTPSFTVMVQPISMGNQILSMVLNVGGQQLQYSHGPQVPQLINWPGSTGVNQASIQLNLADGTTATLSASGPWALNRLLDKAKQVSHSSSAHHDDSALQATFNIQGHTVVLGFTPNSIFSPFKLPAFSCPNMKSI